MQIVNSALAQLALRLRSVFVWPHDKTIGLKRGTVKLTSNYKLWKKVFEIEKSYLTTILGERMISIEHIGSTSIPGLLAKPIIDILMGVKDLNDVEQMHIILVAKGYTYRGNCSNDKRILYVKGSEELRTHHLHITEYMNSLWQRDIYFRDYLIANPIAREEYALLKKGLAESFGQNRELYTKGKADFIISVLKNMDLEIQL